MHLKVGFAWTKVVEASATETAFLKQYLTFREKGARGATKTRSLLRPGRLFPSGLARRLCKAARDSGYIVQIAVRTPGQQLVPLLSYKNWTPRKHQAEAIKLICQQPRGLIQHATGCLSGDTVIEANRKGWSFKVPLRDLACRMRGERIGRGGGPLWDLSVPTTVRYRDQDGYIRLGLLQDAYSSGRKVTYVVTTECGKSIRATADHRFMTEQGWRCLGELQAGDSVWVTAGAPTQTRAKYHKSYYKCTGLLPRHPYAGRRNVRSGFSVPTHRLVVEAKLNNMELSEFLTAIRSPDTDISQLTFIDPAEYHVHHIDENSLNNNPDNLLLVTPLQHQELHGRDDGWRNVTERTCLSTISSIVEYGEEETFDITMATEPHNFVANGFVVHNSGKGDLICFLACCIIKGPVLIITSSRKLLDDLHSRCIKFGFNAGRMGGGCSDKTQRVIVSTDDSLKKFTEKELLRFTAVLVDECHGVAAGCLWKTLMQCLNAEIRLGFSATSLDRADRKGLYIIGALGDTIHRYTPEQASADGVIAQARLRMVLHNNQPTSTADGYTEWEKAAIANNRARNLKLLRLIDAAPSPRIVFVRTKEHQAALVQKIGELYCDFVNDETSPENMERILDRFRKGVIPTLVSTPIFRQGVDIPEIMSVINGAGGKAVIDVIQKVGRGSRRMQANGTTKNEFWVWDIDDKGCGCGGAHKGCEWFEKHSAARRRAYAKFGYKVLDS